MRVLLVLVLLTLAPAAQAAAIFPTTDVTSSGGTCSINRDHEMVADQPGEGKAYTACSFGGAAYSSYFTHTVSEASEINGPLELTATLGCDLAAVSTGAGGVTASYRFILFVDGQSSGNKNGNWDNVCLMEEFEVSVGHDFGVVSLAPGAQIRIQLLVFYTTTSQAERPNFYLKTGATQLMVPGLYEAPVGLDDVQTIFEDLDVPVVEHAFTNATSDDYQFNFTVANGTGLVELDINGTGFANATLVDAAGKELINGTLVSGITEFQNFTAGNWTLFIDYTEFNGTLRFAYQEGASVQAEIPEHTAPVDHNGTAGNETLMQEPDAQEAPGLPLAILAVGLIAAGRLRRRD